MNGGEPPVDTATFEPSSENPISLPEPQAAPPNPEELVAKAIAPVKAEFLRPPPSRSRSDGAGEKNSVSSNVVKEKKSKRQLKRERQQEQKSATHICSEVAKLGKVDACRYGGKCRFSHDLDAYLAQKPADLEGTCPFNIVKELCPYGLTCRFASTHSEGVSLEDENTPKKNFEINGLNKDLQRLLWKNKVSFPKSSAQLKLLGLSVIKVDSNLKPHAREKKLIDFRRKLYLAPLTTVGNLPFRRVCRALGADITCGEMAMCTNLLQGQASEWALLRRHSSEEIFGVQICGSYPDTVARTVELIDRECAVDFIDINMGCPIDIVVNKGAGSSLLTKPMRMKGIIQAASGTVDKPITVKVRTGYFEGRNRIDSLISDIKAWGGTAVTIHGRSRQQRYSKLADWDYINLCANKAPDNLQVLGNGDIFSYHDWNMHISDCSKLSSCMVGRGALIKPWIFTEIKEQRDWDISSTERFDILKDFVRFGLQHWGSDNKGVETTRHFMLEWLSYTCRYIPVGLLDVIPQRINWRLPSYYGRNDLETLMASDSAADWIRISEMLLGKVPEGFSFAPKHKSNAYDRAENG
ncbi:tRNA-dihydrouridine(47) synthase [NAD(P)(+)]-like [Dioscorea cayenensis subsp. rotundata]|uniref:tRNA-dihydrouridine(47) synthase [NAD(P)(+)] n=1 Tax=Dioscorea cayennensis subsp. rotundata TaxID=55577 RepID=A0AB40B707_DIOCR|nr:tRNA-dihydrouridine(47) synthase [NAD(P)(+)]-like [Dioscorea cayenensis subsp. rotundata]